MTGTIILFVGIIVGACIIGGATYAGLAKVADALNDGNRRQNV